MLSIPASDLSSIFEKLPGLNLVLTPGFFIVAASDGYLQTTMKKREELVGRSVFDIFPGYDNEDRLIAESNLKDSVNYVLQYRRPHTMAILKYAVRKPDGVSEERFWAPVNTPVLNDDNEVAYIIHNVTDVTGRKRSEEKFRSLLEASPDSSMLVDEKGIIVMNNRQAEELFGYNREELMGKPVGALVPSEFRDEHEHHLGGFMNAGKKRCMSAARELCAVKKNGQVFPVDISLSPVHTEEGVLVLTAVRDISQNKKELEQLESLTSQINQSHDAIIILDADNNIKSWNLGAENLYGFTKEEALGKNQHALLKTEATDTEIHNAHEQIALMDYWKGELKRKTKAGRGIYVYNTKTAIRNKEGKITGYTSVSFDITKQKKLQEEINHLASMVEQSSEAIISGGFDQRIISWNKGAEKLFGFTKEEAIGKKVFELGFARFTEEQFIEIDKELLKNGIWKTEGEHFHKNGSRFCAEVTANAVKNEEGEITSMVFIAKDISSRKQLEDVLRKSNEGLEEKIKERTGEIIDSEKRYRSLFENNPMPMWLIEEKTFRFLDVNEMAILRYGYSREEFLSMTAADIRPKEDREHFIRTNLSFEYNAANFNRGIWKHQKKDGTIIYVEIIVHPLVFQGLPARLVLSNDVTERQKTEEKLIASEKRYQTLFENNPMPLWIMNAQTFRYLDVNDTALQKFGYSREEFLSLKATDIIAESEWARFRQSYSSFEANKTEYNRGVWKQRKKDGSIVQAEITVHPVLLEGVPSRLILSNDVTDRQKAEEKLIASEERYRSTLDNMLEGIQIVGFDWRYIYVNNAFAKQAKFTKEDLIGHNVLEMFPGLEKSEILQKYRQCFDERIPVQSENKFDYPDGTSAWFELSFQPVPEGVFVLSIDITERKKSEAALSEERERFAKIAATAPGLIYSFRLALDGTYSFPYASDYIDEILGVSHEMVKTDASTLISSPLQVDAELVLTTIAASARHMQPWKLEFRYIHPAKGLIWLEGNSIPMYEPGGSIIWHGIITDITERKLAEEKLNEQRARLHTISDNLPGMMIYQIAGDSFETRKFTYVSNGVTELTGKTPEEVMKDPALLYSLIVEEDISKLLAAEMEAYQHMGVFNIEVRSRNYKNEIRWINLISTPRKLANGQMVWDGFYVDITERKKAEAAISESEEKYRTLVDQAFDGVMIYSPAGAILECNNSAISNMGYTMEELRAMTIADLFSREDLIRRPLNLQVLESGMPTLDYRKLKTKSGLLVETEVVTRKLPNGNLIAVGRDISERRKAEREKEFDHNNLDALINNTQDLIWSVDRNYKLITSNTAFNGLIEVMTGENVERGTDVLISHFNDPELKRYKAYYDRAFAGETFTEIEHLTEPVEYWSEISFHPIFEGESVIGTACFSRNINGRMKAEEKLKKIYNENKALAERMTAIINALPADIALLDKKGTILEVNDPWRKFADSNGYKKPNYGIGENYINISDHSIGADEKEAKKIVRGVRDVLKGKLKEFVFEYPYHGPDKERWFRMVVAPLVEKEYEGAVVMHIDITELHQLEQERLQSKLDEQKKVTLAMLKGQEKERNYIGQELHDNVNQILVGTKMYLALAARKNKLLEESIKYPMDLIDSSIEEIRTLTHRMVTPLKDINLEELVADLLKYINKGNNTKSRLNYSLPDSLISDDLKLNIYRMIQELTNNIQKYAEAKNVQISMESHGRLISIVVADDGKGFNLDAKRNGIGISNIINRVDTYNGKVQIKSSPGKGTKVSIKIPVDPLYTWKNSK